MGKIIGIDLGTTNSLVAGIEGEKPVIIPTKKGSLLLKSVVRFLTDGQCTTGDSAYRAIITDSENTITSIKRIIGRKHNEIFDLSQRLPYQILPNEDQWACVKIQDNLFTPQEISAVILRELKSCAENYFGYQVNDAVITVPAYFSERQKNATKEAGELAGLNVRRIIHEPTAAALAYGLNCSDKDLKIAIFDLGGGTFDISILELGDGVFEVKSISGDGFLGGDDFDRAIEQWLINEIEIQFQTRLAEDNDAIMLIKDAAIKAKIELSSTEQVNIVVPYLPMVDKTFRHVEVTLTRDHFNEICEELFSRLVPPCRAALKEAGLSGADIDRVVLVGGASRMPKIRDIVWDIFKSIPSLSINPDEAVALGAAIQAGVLNGEVRDTLLLDVLPVAVGLETADGLMFTMLDNNTTIPTKKTEIFSTAFDQQPTIEINILEGNNQLAVNNRSLGRLVLDNLIPASAGEPEIEVSFDVDSNGILFVSARDRLTGKSTSLRVVQKPGLTEDQFLKKLPLQHDY